MNDESLPLADNEKILRGGTEIEGMRIDQLDLQKQAVNDVDFRNCVFSRARLMDGSFANCTFEDCKFFDSDLTMVRLVGTGLFGVQFFRSKLMGINWTQVRSVPDVRFENCVLDHSSFVGSPLRKVVFKSCRLLEVNFVDADLRQTDFSGSDLNGCRFLRTNLGSANLSTATRYVIDPINNTVKNARFSLEGAINLTEHFGIKVEGFEAEDE